MTGLAGLPVYLDLTSVSDGDKRRRGQILNLSPEHLHIKQQSWTDRQTLLSMILPVPNEHLRGLVKVNADMVGFMQSHSPLPQKVATLDQDATLIETAKLEAFCCYKKFKAYQPVNTWWAEQGMVLHTEFRDGYVPAG